MALTHRVKSLNLEEHNLNKNKNKRLRIIFAEKIN